MTAIPREVEMIAAALGRIVHARVTVMERTAWDAMLRTGGDPTRLREPPGPYRGVQGNPGFEFAAASGLGFTAGRGGEPGLHIVRRDENDPPEERINTDSHIVIENLPAHAEWPATLRFAGLEDAEVLRGACAAYVYAYPRRRNDHHSADVPGHIAAAKPKEDTPT